jgi:hypothetical protein
MKLTDAQKKKKRFSFLVDNLWDRILTIVIRENAQERSWVDLA